MTKAELRQHLTGSLREMAQRPEQRALASAEICAAVRREPAWNRARLVCAFLPLSAEPQIAPLWEEPGGREFCFPRVAAAGVELIRIEDPRSLGRTNWRFDAPEFADALRINPAAVDLFLVPGLAFTRDGVRLGRGGGYYDRLLPQRAPASTALGLCFAMQLLDTLPAEPHDHQVDAVITEHGRAV